MTILIDADGCPMVYTAGNIDAMLNERHTSKKIRMAGGRLKGPSKRTAVQDAEFERKLKELTLG